MVPGRKTGRSNDSERENAGGGKSWSPEERDDPAQRTATAGRSGRARRSGTARRSGRARGVGTEPGEPSSKALAWSRTAGTPRKQMESLGSGKRTESRIRVRHVTNVRACIEGKQSDSLGKTTKRIQKIMVPRESK